MNTKILIITAFFTYYLVWLFLPIFDLKSYHLVNSLFPIPSIYAVYLPIAIVLGGSLIVVTFLGYLLITQS
ncbi:uncharacterized protein SCDLUD_004818 [Saccharomycodes ludwigii]|uniref:uncharacterized protein n=1 Tax=Saccharomycodes ludwigii TaxID=36035 RepID=UPI001E82ADC0|nr:hypothetical protein SCDLUD_004818 [Saccharomycodes ludwigii]KAH3899375.1 hypothetical protein SCDLUD_004818 [Saccharomycodes ludwigii]